MTKDVLRWKDVNLVNDFWGLVPKEVRKKTAVPKELSKFFIQYSIQILYPVEDNSAKGTIQTLHIQILYPVEKLNVINACWFIPTRAMMW